MFYLSFPVTYIILVALLFDVPANNCLRILLSPFYYLVAFLAVAVGYGLWEMRKWAWYVFLITNVLIGYENAIVVQDYSASHHKVSAFIASLLMLIFIIIRVAREVRVPYFFPKIRWWESNPRYRLAVPVQMNRKNGTTVEGEILDISMGGCFVKLRADLAQDEGISLRFTVFGHPLACDGTIVWRTDSTVTHPRGVGVKFGDMDRENRKALRQVNRRLKKIAALYRSSRYLLNQEEFLKRLEELESQGVDRLRMS